MEKGGVDLKHSVLPRLAQVTGTRALPTSGSSALYPLNLCRSLRFLCVQVFEILEALRSDAPLTVKVPPFSYHDAC